MPTDHTSIRTNNHSHLITDAVSRAMPHELFSDWEKLKPFADKLFYGMDEGHTYLPLQSRQVNVLANMPVLVGNASEFKPFILDKQRLFSGRLWQLEQQIAAHLLRLARGNGAKIIDWHWAAEQLHYHFNHMAEAQKTAVALALIQPLMLINGGPGTGKTTTVASLLMLLCQNMLRTQNKLPRIVLAAPTGKAAAHMADAFQVALNRFSSDEGVETHLRQVGGQTLHRLLKLRPPLLQTPYSQENSLSADIVVVDEVSMLDLSLLHTLLDALKTGTRLILLGDHNQLPAVGLGDVVRDLAQKTILPRQTAEQLRRLLPEAKIDTENHTPPLSANVVTLSQSHRFDAESGIGLLASAVTQGNITSAAQAFSEFPEELVWRQILSAKTHSDLYQIQQNYWQAVRQNNPAAVFAALKQVMVLVVRRDDATAFNQAYRDYLSLHEHSAQKTWFAGLPLMVSQNDYSVGLYNGDIGVVLPDKKGVLQAYFDGGSRCVALSRLPEHEDAFAITVHKSQGSEYDTVYLLPPNPAINAESDQTALFSRALLYTAITRAKSRFVFLELPETFQAALNTHSIRRSGLRTALQEQNNII